MVFKTIPSYLVTDAIASVQVLADDPNQRADCAFLGTWSSTSDVDTFLSKYNHANNYIDGTTKLHIGDTINIMDGTYNGIWYIAGFDVEHNRTAADGTVYDNGYGIMLWPRRIKGGTYEGYWNSRDTTSGGYKSSLAHSKTNTIATNIKNSILGTHLVNRNVLLSSAIDTNGGVSAATWTTAYGTLISFAQLYGLYTTSIYNDGEAYYKLPLFSYCYTIRSVDIWTRIIDIKSNSGYMVMYIKAESILSASCASNHSAKYYCPLLYIR